MLHRGKSLSPSGAKISVTGWQVFVTEWHLCHPVAVLKMLCISNSASSSHHQQAGSFHSQQQTWPTERWKIRSVSWKSIILSLSDVLQQNLVVKFSCLTVLWNFMEKSARFAEISLIVTGVLVHVYPVVINITNQTNPHSPKIF